MTDMLETGAVFLAEQMELHCSREVTYARGVDAVALPATKGRSIFRYEDANGVLQRIELADFLLSPARLVLSGQDASPLPGDTILEVGTDAARTYVVCAEAGEPCWRWSSLHRTRMRVHTKLQSEVAV